MEQSRLLRSAVECFALPVEAYRRSHRAMDWESVKEMLDEAAGKRDWLPDLPLVSRLPGLFADCRGSLYAIVAMNRVLDLRAERPGICVAALDIGTTTIAGYLMRNDASAPIATCRTMNPQRRYGDDVILRAKTAVKRGTEKLSGCVRETIDQMLGKLCEKAGVEREAVFAVCIVGNTCMHHLFLGVSPESLIRAPYNPIIREGLTLRAADFGLRAHPNAVLMVPPVIAGFVGSNTVGCMLSCHWESMDKLTLMIDIDTNGEIVLGNSRRMVACSVAAGPAFEGAAVSCGMYAMRGAIDRVYLQNERLHFHVLGEAEPVGICGSGMIDLLAVLRRTGEIDESGRLAHGDTFRLPGTEIFLTQKDVRELQLAKAAFAAGIRLLCQRMNVGVEDIERVFIAGNFGSYLYPDSACTIGLFPIELRQRISHIGNAAAEGARLILINREAWDYAQRLAEQTEFLSLPSLPDFRDELMDAARFPSL